MVGRMKNYVKTCLGFRIADFLRGFREPETYRFE